MKNKTEINQIEFKSLYDLRRRFPTEQSCRDFLEQERWHGTIVCPHCGAYGRISKYSNGKTYFCGDCRKQFTVKVGTMFEDSALLLQKWFMAMYLITAHKKGISSLQLSRDIDVTQKTAWFVLHRVREMLKRRTNKKLSGTIEADETYIGGKEKNKHANKRQERTQGGALKTPVFGLLQRNGMITSKPVTNVSKETLQAIINRLVRKGSRIMTDDHVSYQGLHGKYYHRRVFHSYGEHSIGLIHINTIEGFWSLLKRGIIGIYHQVSEKHLHRYCNEFNFRYNSKKIKDTERFTVALSQCEGRLQYSQLIQ